MALYDRIGNDYDTTRRADPLITATLSKLLSVRPQQNYIDFACGTANYTAALQAIGGSWAGCDLAPLMLTEARQKAPQVNFVQANVEKLPFAAQCFNGGLCTLALHHFDNLSRALGEMCRVLKADADLVLFTATPEQMQHYWLCDYFPNMMRLSGEQMPALEDIAAALVTAGWAVLEVVPFHVTDQLQDFFLYSGKFKPDMYLSAEVRNGISSFRRHCGEAELQMGLAALQRDINSGLLLPRIKNSAQAEGDYCFIVARKIV